MNTLSFEPIIFLLLFILIPLANYVLKRIGQRFESPHPRRSMPDMGVRRRAAPPAEVSTALREQDHERPPVPTTPARPARRRWSRRTLFRTKSDTRQTIVAMTILGPCRAYDPPH